MTDHLAPLVAAVDSARAVWGEQAIESLAPGALMKLMEGLAEAQRLLDAGRARVAAEIARQSRPELGPAGLAKTQGFRNPTALIASVTGSGSGEAARLVKVGEATAPRMTLTGETKPARHPFVAAALEAGLIGSPAASAIITMLDRVALRAEPDALTEAERTLVEKAPGLAADQFSKLVARAEAFLDPAGVARREDELRAERSTHMYEDRNGMLVVNSKFDPEHGAPVKAYIETYVSAQLAAQRDENAPDAARPTIPQLQADALAHLAAHALGCAGKDLPSQGATVVVRIDHTDLVNETGYATIDGLTQPISVATARRMAGGGGIISCVFGSESEILDWGRRKRLYTEPQRLALVERDGGCAMCGAPPSHTKAHHIRWWARDAGPTDLSNGVLLCESCHHRIHDNGWDIRIDGAGTRARVWFIPPAHVDSARTPRLGGRARFDYAA
ncbi:HNH endonuclease [Microbacterium sp. HD4P20]|uniref:HNH endonuclease n=1 Tax=Microbacterium sp. HD4P20 TaxID=2864874 RepID=UPI0020A4B5F9|nr:HNH endonuclease signature motif containing protein [Microbacterium sp. HD4P20]MCP2638092.1 HNH endonuclease [Microbacterium sp. HD4P20]